MAESLTPRDHELEHSKLRFDIEVARAYGEARPDEWTDLFIENEPTVRIVMLFADSRIGIHERELRSLVSHPEQIEVRRTKYSLNRLQQIREEVHALVSSPATFRSLGLRKGRVHIRLAADQEELAATLLDRYGDAVDLSVGNFPFPMPDQPSASSGRKPARTLPEIPLILLEGLKASLSGGLVVKSGRSALGSLVFTNNGPRDVTLNTNGTITGRIVRPDTGEVVGGYVGMQAMPLVRFFIPRDETVSVPLLVDTASFKRELGYAVPPGAWAVDAIVKVQDIGERRVAPLPIVILDQIENELRDR